MFESKISWFSVSLNSILSDSPKQIPPPLFEAVQFFMINPEKVISLFWYEYNPAPFNAEQPIIYNSFISIRLLDQKIKIPP